jgi:hypothetical protein
MKKDCFMFTQRKKKRDSTFPSCSPLKVQCITYEEDYFLFLGNYNYYKYSGCK